MKRCQPALYVIPFLFVIGCATTTHEHQGAPDTWRAPGAVTVKLGTAEPLRVHVTAFGLAPEVEQRYSELVDARVSLGISNRIADALYDSGRFRFIEEKARVAEHIRNLLHRSGRSLQIPDVPWLLDGHIAGLEVERRESVAVLRGKTEIETRVSVQIRLRHQASGQYYPATATGSHLSTRHLPRGQLDADAVAAACEQAVRGAAEKILDRLH